MRGIVVDPSGAAPIWRQIEEGVRRLVATGTLTRGNAVPSVRDLARSLLVNPATVAKAYQRLTDAGVLSVRRGEGTFVAEAAPRMNRDERQRLLHDAAIRYASAAATLGVGAVEAVRAVEAVLTSRSFKRAASEGT